MDHRMYYICKYTPLELAAGFGIEMRPLTSVPMRSSCGECVHPNLCAYGKGLLERALTGEVEALFLVDCCDVVRRIYDVLAAKENGMFLYLMHLPHKDGVREQEIFEKELRKAAEAFAAWTGRTFDKKKRGSPCDKASRRISIPMKRRSCLRARMAAPNSQKKSSL